MVDRDGHMALLLKVITHDLLSPLTAAKWYTELLNKKDLSGVKRHEYTNGVRDAIALGITITKRVQVAGRVLAGGYEPDREVCLLADVMRASGADLVSQFERHGLTLVVAAEVLKDTVLVDKELVALLVWGMAKYLLALAPNGTVVHLTGAIPPAGIEVLYTFSMRAEPMDDAAACVRGIEEPQSSDAYAQASVFSTLIHVVAPKTGATIHAYAEGQSITLTASFDARIRLPA